MWKHEQLNGLWNNKITRSSISHMLNWSSGSPGAPGLDQNKWCEVMFSNEKCRYEGDMGGMRDLTLLVTALGFSSFPDQGNEPGLVSMQPKSSTVHWSTQFTAGTNGVQALKFASNRPSLQSTASNLNESQIHVKKMSMKTEQPGTPFMKLVRPLLSAKMSAKNIACP